MARWEASRGRRALSDTDDEDLAEMELDPHADDEEQDAYFRTEDTFYRTDDSSGVSGLEDNLDNDDDNDNEPDEPQGAISRVVHSSTLAPKNGKLD